MERTPVEVNVNKVINLVDPTVPAPQQGAAQPYGSQQNPTLNTNVILLNLIQQQKKMNNEREKKN